MSFELPFVSESPGHSRNALSAQCYCTFCAFLLSTNILNAGTPE
uniref:Uncharacterized protein n=1 Tax=Anguilla anguilla TaxID=7936 RepID=A0A0E9RNV7_ANGAN